MANTFLESVRARRSIYSLGKNPALSDADIQSTVEQALAQAPAAFGIQPTRVVILLGRQHDKLWSIVLEVLSKLITTERLANTKVKIDSFRAAYATVLFFEDIEVVQAVKNNFPTYADKFDDWSMQAQGIAVYSIWCALAARQIGASIQHYSNLIEDQVQVVWDLPKNWRLLGEMPFGNIIASPAPRQQIDMAGLVKVIAS